MTSCSASFFLALIFPITLPSANRPTIAAVSPSPSAALQEAPSLLVSFTAQRHFTPVWTTLLDRYSLVLSACCQNMKASPCSPNFLSIVPGGQSSRHFSVSWGGLPSKTE